MNINIHSNAPGAVDSDRASLYKDGVPVSDVQRRRNELQNRIWMARTRVDATVALRLFKHPKECVEMADVVQNAKI